MFVILWILLGLVINSYSASAFIWASKCDLSLDSANLYLTAYQYACSQSNGGGSTFEGHVTTNKPNLDGTWTYCVKYSCNGCTSNDAKADSIDVQNDCMLQCKGFNFSCSTTGAVSYELNISGCSDDTLTTGVCAESSSSFVLSSSSVALSSSVGGTSSAGEPTSSTTVHSSTSVATPLSEFCYTTNTLGQCVLRSDADQLVSNVPSMNGIPIVGNSWCQNGYFAIQTNVPLIQSYDAWCWDATCSVSTELQAYYCQYGTLSSTGITPLDGANASIYYCDAITCYASVETASLPSNVSASIIYSLADSAARAADFSNRAVAADYCKSIYSSSSGSESSISSSSRTPISNSSGTSSPWGTSSGSTGGTSGSETGNSSGSNGGSGGDYPSTHSSPGTWDDTKYSFGGNPDSAQGMEEDSPWAWRSDVWSLQKLLASGFNMVKDAVTNITGIADRVQDSLYSYNHQSHSVLDSILQKIPDSLKTTASASQDSAWHSFQAWAAQSLSASSTETYGDSLGDYNDSLVRELITNGIYNDSVYNAKIDSALRGLGYSLGDCNDIKGMANNLGVSLLCGSMGNSEFASYMRTVNSSITQITSRMGSVNTQLEGIQNSINNIPKSDTGVIDAVTDLAAQSASEHNGSVNAINSNGTSIRSQIEASSQALIDAYGENTGDIIGTLEKWGDSMTQAINGIEGGDSLGTGNDTITVAGGGIASDGEGYGSDYDGDGTADALDTTGTGVPASFYDSALGTDATHLAAVQAVGDSAKAFATSLRTATDMPFTDADAYCPTSLSLNPCEVLNGDCTMDVCDTRFNLAGHHLFYWMGVCIEFGAWVMFFMGIKLTRES